MVYTWYIERLYRDVQEIGIQQPQLDKILNVNLNMYILTLISISFYVEDFALYNEKYEKYLSQMLHS